MNENENNFDSLRRLLQLKRQENPPPAYFNDFSSRVTARIRAGEADQGTAARLAAEAPWLMRFLEFFEAKPAFVGGFALALCLIMLGGIVFADRSDLDQSSPIFVDATPSTTMTAPATVASAQASPSLTDSLTQGGGLAVSTNYSLQPVASLFGQSPFNQQVGYTPSGN